MNVADLYSFMTRFRYGVVSSATVDGSPQSALVGIAVTPQLEIVFDTLNTSRKYRNLVARPSCSFVVGWSGEQTVQFDGVASLPVDEELRRYQEVYFRPKWIRYSDFDQNPPLVEEMRTP